MKGMQKKIVFLIIFFLVLAGTIYVALADHNPEHQKKHRHSPENHGEKQLAPVNNQTYKDQCGACHFAYQPELLPSASWEKILTGLDNHFGQAIELDPDSNKAIAEYLKTQAAEKSTATVSVKIMQSVGSTTPLRITETPYIKKKHNEISPNALKKESIESLSNCLGCHKTAKKGIYLDDCQYNKYEDDKYEKDDE